MTTPRVRSLVSLAAALTFPLAMEACASASPRATSEPGMASDDAPRTVRFDNAGREYVHVYLVGDRREWLLGRVEAGAKTTLRIPREAIAEETGIVQMAVVIGDRVSLGAKRASRLAITIPQPGVAIIGQRWTFSQTPAAGQLASLPETERK